MFSTISGLPVHPLLVHATVVIVPLAVALVMLAVLVPRFRAWAGPLPAGTALVALVLTPLSTATGESLEHDLPESSLIEEHAHLGDQLLPLTIALFVFAAGFWWLTRHRGAERFTTQGRLVAVVGVVAVLAAIGTGVQVVRIGHSGAKASWSKVGSSAGHG
jgi:hypothetical protein